MSTRNTHKVLSLHCDAVACTVETTAPDTFEREALRKKRPVTRCASRSIVPGSAWMFTDGSGSGWHAAAVLRPGREPQLIARHRSMPMKNVAAEMNGLLLALGAVQEGEHVAVVSDYLWDIYYVLGWFDVRAEALVELTAEARTLLASRRPQTLRYIHTRGHRNDGSDFGFWNEVADQLCRAQIAVDRPFPENCVREAMRSHSLRDLLLAA